MKRPYRSPLRRRPTGDTSKLAFWEPTSESARPPKAKTTSRKAGTSAQRMRASPGTIGKVSVMWAVVVSWDQRRFKAFKTELPGTIQLVAMAYLTTRVKALREAKQRTQQELAAESGVSVTTISRYENERVTMFSAKVLERLGQAWDVQPGLLLVRVE